MAPPQRRGGGSGNSGGSGGGSGGGTRSGRGRGRGGRGGAGGRGGGGGEAAAPSTSAPSASTSTAVGANARHGKSKQDKGKPRKGGADGRARVAPGNGRCAGGSAAATSGGGGGGAAGSGSSGAKAGPRSARQPSVVARKVLVRNIPHDTDEEEMRALVEAHGAPADAVWRVVPGRVRHSNRPPRPMRVYLDFKKEADLARAFIEKLNGYTFPGKAEQPVEVDFAPLQKIPREKQRKDTKVGTLERDSEYLAFLEALAKPKEKLPSADVAADAKEGDVVEKPVAALVLYMNERRRDKGKSKFISKLAEKGRGGVRGKAAKDTTTKAAKDRAKTAKSKGKPAKNGPAKAASKDGGKAMGRKPRVKPTASELSAPPPTPGAVKIMPAKPRNVPAATEGQTALPPARPSSDTKTKAKAGGKGPRGGGRGGAKENASTGSSDAGGAGAAASPSGRKETKNRPRRENNRAGRGAGSEGGGAKNAKSNGSSEPKKKVFAPKQSGPSAPVG